MVPFHRQGSIDSRLQSHNEETVYFKPFKPPLTTFNHFFNARYFFNLSD